MAPKRSPSPGRGRVTPRGNSPRGARPSSPRGARPNSGKSGGPKAWPTCEWCQQQFSPSSLPIHQKKCAARPDLKEVADAVAELARIEGPRPLDPVADWAQCPNCGEQYGEFALPPHMKRCKRLLPFGKIKDGKQYGSGPPPAGVAKPAFDDFGSGLSQEELEAIRELFDRHDADSNERLDEAELGALLRECFPARLMDASRLLAEFQLADVDGDGTVGFPEFARYYAVLKEMGDGGLSPEEIAWLRAVFDRFDGDSDGELTMRELADLLRQCFPSRTKDTKKLMAEIKAADLNKDGKVRSPCPEPSSSPVIKGASHCDAQGRITL